MKRLGFIFRYTKGFRFLFILLLFCIVFTTFSGSFYPMILRYMINDVIEPGKLELFGWVIAVYGVVFLVNQIMHFVLNMTWANLMTKFLFVIRRDVFKKVISYEGKNLADIHSGDVIYRMGPDVEQVMNYIHRSVFYLFAGILSLGISVYLIYLINPAAAVLTLIMVPTTVYLSRLFAKIAAKHYKQISKEKGLLSSWLFEILKGLQDLKSLGAVRNVVNVFTRRNISISRLEIKTGRVEVVTERVNIFVSLIGQFFFFIVAGILVSNNGGFLLGDFVAVIAYYEACVSSFNSINKKITSMEYSKVSIDRVRSVFEKESEEFFEDLPALDLSNGSKIEFKNVSFSYENDNYVLKDLDVTVCEKEMIAIVGKSGAGKSTFASLLLRFYKQDKGDILINNQDVNSFSLKSIRENIGLVQQDAVIFPGTVRYNLIFSNDNSRDDELMDALNKSCLLDFVNSLDDGLDTVIGEGKRSLSGGQKQRLAIARVFLKNPKILIFDESTSSLDGNAEKVIKDVWENLKKDKTLIVIAHRLSTIIQADRVIVLEDGHIVGDGDHKDLLENSRAYNDLFREQYFFGGEEA